MRPQQRWIDRVKYDLKRLNNGTNIEDTDDREGWIDLVEAAKRLNDAGSKKNKIIFIYKYMKKWYA